MSSAAEKSRFDFRAIKVEVTSPCRETTVSRKRTCPEALAEGSRCNDLRWLDEIVCVSIVIVVFSHLFFQVPSGCLHFVPSQSECDDLDCAVGVSQGGG